MANLVKDYSIILSSYNSVNKIVSMNNKLSLYLLFILMLSLGIGMYLIKLKSFDNFAPHDLMPLNDPSMDFPLEKERYQSFVKIDNIPGFIYLSLVFMLVCNLTTEQLMFIPIGSLLLPLGYFIFAKHISNNYINTLLLTFYIIFESGLILGFYNFYKYTFVSFLFFITLTLYISTKERNNDIKYHYIGLLLLVIGMVTIHYALSIVAIIVLLIDSLLGKINYKERSVILNNTGILLTYILIFIIIQNATITTYFVEFESKDIINIINRATARITTYLGVEDTNEGYETFQIANNNVLLLRSIRVLLLILPLVIYVVFRYLLHVDTHPLNSIIWAIFITVIIHTIIYTNIGSLGIISNSYLLLFPFIVIATLEKIKNTKQYISSIYLLTIIIINIFTFLLAIGDIDYSSRYETMKDITRFVNNHIINKYQLNELIKPNILIDHRSMGVYLMSNSDNILFNPVYFTNERYHSLLYSQYVDYQHAILHIDNKLINSTNWKKYKSVNEYVDIFNKNHELNRVYSNNITIILKTQMTM